MLLRRAFHCRAKSYQIGRKFRGLKIGLQPEVLEKGGKCGILRRAQWLLLRRAGEAIERENESPRATKKQVRRDVFCWDEIRVGRSQRAQGRGGKGIVPRIDRGAPRERVRLFLHADKQGVAG